MPQFDVSTYYSQIFWLVIIFGGLYFLILKFVSPKAEKIFNDRQFIIKENISLAEQLNIETKTLSDNYDIKLKEISNDLSLYKKEALNSLELSFSSKKEILNRELNNQIAQNLNEINIDIKEFWQNENDGCKNLASAIIKKISAREIDFDILNSSYKKMK